MEQARWNQIEDLLQAALDRPPAERAAFLSDACGTDDELSREVAALLANEGEGSFLESPAAASLPPRIGRAPLTGKRIGHYAIEKWIGAGGMGEVYEARDDRLQRTVALKALPAEFMADAERVARFEQEALAASRLNQPNIITIFEIVHEDDVSCIVTERVDGDTLRALLTGADGKPRKLSIAHAIDIAIQIASALKAAHTAWIIHRDIKPENVMVRSDDLVKVLDFGIAKLSDEPGEDATVVRAPLDALRSELTVPGAVLGTASYMSPEQSRGEPLDGRTDLYSLGLVFFEMLTGTRLGADRVLPAPALDAVPKDVQRIVRKMLRIERDERYASAGELLDDLARARRRIESRTARRMVGWSVLAIVFALTLAAFAALLSVQETWDERVLRDGHRAAARQAVFSPDGRVLVSCAEDGQIIVWDFERRQRHTTITGKRAHKIAFSPDGRWLASGGTDGTISIWDTRTWTQAHELRDHRLEVGFLGFSPDGTSLASADGHETVLWSVTRWAKLREWSMGAAHSSVLFSPDGQQFLQANSLTEYDVKAGTFFQNDIHTGGNWIAMSPDRTHMALIDTLGNLSIYRFASPGDLRRPERLSRRRAHQDHGRGVAYSPDGRLIASASEDVLLWDAATQQKLARFEHPAIVWSIAFSPDGRHLVSTHADGALLIWDVAGRERIANLNEHSGAVRAVAFAPDGRHVASAGEDRSITVWDSETGRKEAVLRAHETRVTAVAFGTNGKRLASADQDGVLLGWDLAAGTHRRITESGPVPSYFVAISPDDRVLAHTAGVHAADDGHLLEAFFLRNLANRGAPYDGEFSQDGRLFAHVTDGGWVVLHDPATWNIVAKHRLPKTHLISISISRDRKWLVTGEDEGAVRLWSVDPLRPVAVIGRHAARIKSVALSPDGRTAASAADDKTIVVWDVKRRKLRARVGTHSSPIYSIAFSPDGRRLLSGEHDRSVRIYTRHRSVWGFDLE